MLFSSFSAISQDPEEEEEVTDFNNSEYNHAVDTNQSVFRPRLGIGIGMIGYRGELNQGLTGYNPFISRWGHSLYASAPLNAYLRLEFGTVFGQVGADQRTLTDNYNFKSRIRMGSVQLYYNFYPLVSNYARRYFNPFIATGISSFEFLSKTDFIDGEGRQYHYWSDGNIMDRPENDPDAANAIRLTRDYTYESDLRELDLDGIGKYREQSFAIPITFGFEFHFSPRIDFRVSSSYFFTFTDLIDNISDAGEGDREGDKRNDRMVYTNISLSYDLVGPQKDKTPKDFDNMPNDIYVWQDSTDTDGDGVIDMVDECAKTPLIADVDLKGCPIDTDRDGVPDYLDDEPYFSREGFAVNEKGVEITDEEWEKRYLRYRDTTGEHVEYTYIYTIKPGNRDNPIYKEVEPKSKKEYIIVLGKEHKNVSANDLHKYLGFKNFEVIEKNDTMYYVVGNFENIEDAVLTKEDLENKGVKVSSISRTSGDNDNVIEISENAIKRISDQMKKENKTLDKDSSSDHLFRVQIGAFSKKVDENMFKDVPDLVFAKGADGLIRYYSGSFETVEEAAKRKTDMVLKGYKTAFIVGYKDAERVTLVDAGVEVTENYSEKEDQETFVPNETLENDTKKEVFYRVKVGEFKGEVPVETIDLYLAIGGISPKKLEDGTVIYFTNKFNSLSEAEEKISELKEAGIESPSVLVEYNGQFMSLEEAKDIIEN